MSAGEEKRMDRKSVCEREVQSQTNSASRHLIKCPLSLYFEKWTLVLASWLAIHKN